MSPQSTNWEDALELLRRPVTAQLNDLFRDLPRGVASVEIDADLLVRVKAEQFIPPWIDVIFQGRHGPVRVVAR